MYRDSGAIMMENQRIGEFLWELGFDWSFRLSHISRVVKMLNIPQHNSTICTRSLTWLRIYDCWRLKQKLDTDDEREKVEVRIDFTPRRSLLGCEVRFLSGNLIDFTFRRSGSGRKVNFYQSGFWGLKFCDSTPPPPRSWVPQEREKHQFQGLKILICTPLPPRSRGRSPGRQGKFRLR